MTLNAKTLDSEKLPTPIVRLLDGKPSANSRDIAVDFEKQVRHVNEAIRNLMEKDADWGSANFRPNVINDLSGVSVADYDMTKDGFSMLVMGFTGKAAFQWKLRYIAAFNAMEEKLRQIAGEAIEFDRDGDELTAWGVPLRKLAVQNQTIRTILALEGIESARATARKDKTYPLARGFAIRELVDTSQDDPNGCLRHLFRSKGRSGSTVGILFDLALRDVASRPALRSHGIIIDPGARRGYVAIASAHPFLRQVFAATQWAENWSRALRLLPGAVPTKKTLPFGGGASAAILLPQRAIVALRQPEIA